MAYYGITRSSSSYLMHHGVKGQKWGVRRYQNEDGTLTAEGRRHYGLDKLDPNSDKERISKLSSREAKRQMDLESKQLYKNWKRTVKYNTERNEHLRDATTKEINKLDLQALKENHEYLFKKYGDKLSPKDKREQLEAIDACDKMMKGGEDVASSYEYVKAEEAYTAASNAVTAFSLITLVAGVGIWALGSAAYILKDQ